MKELLHDDDIREEGREAGRVQGRAEGRAEGESLLLALISRMATGGDADKAAQLGAPEVLKAIHQGHARRRTDVHGYHGKWKDTFRCST